MVDSYATTDRPELQRRRTQAPIGQLSVILMEWEDLTPLHFLALFRPALLVDSAELPSSRLQHHLSLFTLCSAHSFASRCDSPRKNSIERRRFPLEVFHLSIRQRAHSSISRVRREGS
ncbi:hypothetical protein BDR07DRAFT_1422380 [Suillus spraguei]|nr:hypothetical protein BDR07DRAFT_1422380 [Suillus spraguei]